jgi:hypothetical protein
VLIPGLLMLATFGLERVESSLRRDTISSDDVAEFLQQAEASDVDTLARDGMDSALLSLAQRRGDRDATAAAALTRAREQGLPTREYFHHLGNTEFRQTSQANPV